MAQSETVELSFGGMRASIAALGAELRALSCGGRELLWHGDPASWAQVSPLLFPIIGRAAGGVITIEGTRYPMGLHGFLQHMAFTIDEAGPAHCVMSCTSTPDTLAVYPFPFAITVAYRLDGQRLTLDLELVNRGPSELVAQLGLHPGLAWPLLPEDAPTAYSLRFSPAIVPLNANRTALQDGAAPVDTIRLAPSRFDGRAEMYGRAGNVRVQYCRNDEPMLALTTGGLEFLALWTSPGAPFICIEPWQGMIDPPDFAGEFSQKLGVIRLAPAASHTARLEIDVVSAGLRNGELT